jgi:hypothetical protein
MNQTLSKEIKNLETKMQHKLNKTATEAVNAG